MIILGVNELLSKQSIIVTVSISLDDLVLGILILILTLPLPKHKQCTRIARFEQYNILICEFTVMLNIVQTVDIYFTIQFILVLKCFFFIYQ